jgi:ATP-dependent Clp protease protease subunit
MAYKIQLFDTDFDCIGTGVMSLDYISYQLQCAAGQDVEIDISSGGGSAFDAVAIYNQIKKYSGKVTTDNISLAGSAASTIWLAGSVRRMSKYALVMIHPAQYVSVGESGQLAADAEMIQKVTDNVIAILVDVTGQSVEKITELVNATTWLNAEEALALGLATEVYDTGDNSLEELGITNGSLISNRVKAAPTKYQQVINKILTPKQAIEPQNNNDMAQVTKEELDAVKVANQGFFKKVMNFFTASNMTKVTTNKGELFIPGNLVIGAPVFNDADMDGEAEDAADVSATNAAGEKITLSIVGGKVANVKKDDTEEDGADGDDEDIEADNKVVLNQVGISFKKVGNKIDHKAIKNATIKN